MMEGKKQATEMCDLWRLLDRHGLVDTIFNHLSCAFLSSENVLLLSITPAYVHPIAVTPSSIKTVPLRLYSKAEATDIGVNPDGMNLHTHLHLERGRPGYIAHLHSPHCVAVSSTKDGLLPLSQTAMEFVENIILTKYDGLARDNAPPATLLSLARIGGAALLRHHGPLFIADTAAEIFYLSYYLELACRMQVLTLSQGVQVDSPDEASWRPAGQALQADRREVAAILFEAMKSLN